MTGHEGAVGSSARTEAALDHLLAASRLATQGELPALFRDIARRLGALDLFVYLADLQQQQLLRFLPDGVDAPSDPPPALGVDATLAGRCYQHLEPLSHTEPDGTERLWLPLQNGAERLGVVLALLPPGDRDDDLVARLTRLAAVIGELVMTKTSYGDAIVRLRRREPLNLAAELLWSLLPPLTFAGHEIVVAGALEPAYQVAGDTLDYAVDTGRTRAAVFDGMGHGMRSSQLAAVSVAAYRSARRRGATTVETAQMIHTSLLEVFGGEAFTTGVLVDLDTSTGALSWVNAGHPAPLLFRDNKLVRVLEVRTSPPFGLRLPSDVAPREFSVGSESLEPGDKVVLFSDGVTEARSPEGDFFGDQRLVDLLGRVLAGELPAPEALRRVVRALLDHQQDRLTDDATLLVLDWRGPRPPAPAA